MIARSYCLVRSNRVALSHARRSQANGVATEEILNVYVYVTQIPVSTWWNKYQTLGF